MTAATTLQDAGAAHVPSDQPGVGRPARFSVLSQMAPAICGEVELIRAGPGTGGSLVSISHDDVEVQIGRYDASALTRGAADATRVSVLILLGLRTPSLWEGCRINLGRLLVYAPGSQQFASDGKGACWARITVSAELLQRAFFAATGHAPERPEASFRWLRPVPESLERLKRCLRDLPSSTAKAS